MYGTENWKGYFINEVIKDLKYSSYLELGVYVDGASWHQITCDKKIGVDNNPNVNIEGVIPVSTDEYFESVISEDTRFDLIYIDAYHEKNQVKRDFFNSWKYLNPGGIILMHDINPRDKDETSQLSHGDCFEFWMELVKKYPNNLGVFSGGILGGERPDTLGLWFKGNEKIDESDIGFISNTYEDFIENHIEYIDNFRMEYKDIIER
jgi:hypothetical protein